MTAEPDTAGTGMGTGTPADDPPDDGFLEPVHWGARLAVAPDAHYTEVGGAAVAVLAGTARIVQLTGDMAALVTRLDGRPVRDALGELIDAWDDTEKRRVIELLRRCKTLGLLRDVPADASPHPVDWSTVVAPAGAVTVRATIESFVADGLDKAAVADGPHKAGEAVGPGASDQTLGDAGVAAVAGDRPDAPADADADASIVGAVRLVLDPVATDRRGGTDTTSTAGAAPGLDAESDTTSTAGAHPGLDVESDMTSTAGAAPGLDAEADSAGDPGDDPDVSERVTITRGADGVVTAERTSADTGDLGVRPLARFVVPPDTTARGVLADRSGDSRGAAAAAAVAASDVFGMIIESVDPIEQLRDPAIVEACAVFAEQVPATRRG